MFSTPAPSHLSEHLRDRSCIRNELEAGALSQSWIVTTVHLGTELQTSRAVHLVGTATEALHELAAVSVHGQMDRLHRVISTRAAGINDTRDDFVTISGQLFALGLGLVLRLVLVLGLVLWLSIVRLVTGLLGHVVRIVRHFRVLWGRGNSGNDGSENDENWRKGRKGRTDNYGAKTQTSSVGINYLKCRKALEFTLIVPCSLAAALSNCWIVATVRADCVFQSGRAVHDESQSTGTLQELATVAGEWQMDRTHRIIGTGAAWVSDSLGRSSHTGVVLAVVVLAVIVLAVVVLSIVLRLVGEVVLRNTNFVTAVILVLGRDSSNDAQGDDGWEVNR
uniref:Uncharacterized protein n=1 Tax=Anopheles culicifacies TaxID=139723 RepID=A0A182M279_9DIPT